ncbi:hypothetical protein, partial [Streptomyces mangrovisoli]
MTSASGGRRLAADWAVLGKRPGEVMGYEVLDGSLPRDRAAHYLWGSQTATPEGDRRDGPDALPWRVFLSSAEGEPAAVAGRVETRWDGVRDGTGQPSLTSCLALLDWAAAVGARATWTTLDRAAAAAPWPVPGRDPRTAGESGLTLDLLPASVQELADTVDRLGFDWASGVAALLLDGRQVVITLPAGAEPPDVSRRVLILDAVCALLPYGCRVWLSAATWAGHRAEHRLSLVFAPRARATQLEVALHGAVPREPAGATARTYLAELRRLRAKTGATAELVAHLLRLAKPLPFSESAVALSRLREIDLMDAVLAEIAEGRGDPARAVYVLERQSAGQQDAKIRDLLLFLARCATRTEAPQDAAAARTWLVANWPPGLSGCLGAELGTEPPSESSFGRAVGWLRLAREAGGRATEAFAELLGSVLTAEQPAHARNWAAWRAQLITKAQRDFGVEAEVADPFLVNSADMGLEWVSVGVKDNRLDAQVVERLVHRPAGAPSASGSWPRFVAAIAGLLPSGEARREDAEAFAALGERAWRTALDLADLYHRGQVLDLLWNPLLDVATGAGAEDRAQLARRVHRLAPAEADLAPELAATADLLETGGTSLPRLPRTRASRERYVEALSHRLDHPRAYGEIEHAVLSALLGPPQQPPPGTALETLADLVARRPGLRMPVLDEVAERLRTHDAWLEAELPGDWTDELGRRAGMQWLPALMSLRELVRTDPAPDRLSDAVRRATAGESLSPRTLRELDPWMRSQRSVMVDALAERLEREAPGRSLGTQLYLAIRTGTYGREVQERMRAYADAEFARLARATALWRGPSGGRGATGGGGGSARPSGHAGAGGPARPVPGQGAPPPPPHHPRPPAVPPPHGSQAPALPQAHAAD